MLSREFTFREKVLLAVCAILAIGAFYYQFVYKGINRQINSYSTERIEAQLADEQATAKKIRNMEGIIERDKDKERGELTVYNNLAAEVALIGNILNNRADNVSLTWNNPTLNGSVVRRTVAVAFRTANYEDYKTILREFYEGPYRCIIGDLTVSATGTGKRSVLSEETLAETDGVSASFTVTFYETIEGALTTEGLVVESTGTADQGGGSLAERAHAYEDS